MMSKGPQTLHTLLNHNIQNICFTLKHVDLFHQIIHQLWLNLKCDSIDVSWKSIKQCFEVILDDFDPLI